MPYKKNYYKKMLAGAWSIIVVADALSIIVVADAWSIIVFADALFIIVVADAWSKCWLRLVHLLLTLLHVGQSFLLLYCLLLMVVLTHMLLHGCLLLLLLLRFY